MTYNYSEDALIEQPTIALFKELGWDAENCFCEFDGGPSNLGRDSKGEVVLAQRLRSALERLNPDIPAEAIEQAIEDVLRDRSAMSLAAANRDIYKLLKEGVKVTYRSVDDEECGETVRLIDWNTPSNNDFYLASQLWIAGEMYTRRADLIGFVNGIPLVFIELKAAHKNLKTAYDNNLTDYKEQSIPHLFRYNGFIILSNGSKSRVGSITAPWGHFAEWKKINDEGEEGVISLDTVIRATCTPERLLDIVENFTLFKESQGGLQKVVAKNHQYLGVNQAINAMDEAQGNKGRLGVFWHTQGSGKSISMIFFAQKVMRKVPGNWTFAVVTDRKELDGQIYKNFVDCGVVTETEAQASSGENLKQLLTEDHRYVFTLIHKFHTGKGKKYPKLTDRSDVIVITDEAHRSQYDTLALNMRNALPNASFIAFTGTPLIAGEEKTRDVFGEYVSIYDFKQSIEDGATVPLYYENRIPELQLINEDLNKDIYDAVEDADLDEEQETKLEREFAREYHLITRDDRLDRVAQDLVEHFVNRGFQGKGMVVCIDKATAVKMYDKVRHSWDKYQAELEKKSKTSTGATKAELESTIEYMKTTDMAVIVSQAQNEVADMKKKGLDIAPHRKRMVTEDMEKKFKDDDDPFRLVFVCAMWMTGFDVPSCSTIYLDKPMRNHTLMQTIARANRVFPEKNNGLIVDYVGVFRNLEKALAIYGVGSGGKTQPGHSPVDTKAKLVETLKKAIADGKAFLKDMGVDTEVILEAEGFDKVAFLDEAEDVILLNDDTKKQFLSIAANIKKLFKAIKPDSVANELVPDCALFEVLAAKIKSNMEPVDISEVLGAVEEVLDLSIAAEGYVIRADASNIVDLSTIDFEALKKKFEKGQKHTAAEKLKNAITQTLKVMIQQNRTRMDYMERFQSMIEAYNAGSMNVEEFFQKLRTFANDLDREDKRAISESLSEEELALFDILTKPELELTVKDRKKVKKVARGLLETLKQEKLVLDWRKRQASRAAVRLAIEENLDSLPENYNQDLFYNKCERVYQHVYESYWGAGKGIYANAI